MKIFCVVLAEAATQASSLGLMLVLFPGQLQMAQRNMWLWPLKPLSQLLTSTVLGLWSACSDWRQVKCTHAVCVACLPDYQTEAFVVVVIVHWCWLFKSVRSRDGRRTSQDFCCVILRWGAAVFSCFTAHIQLLEKCHCEWRSALL